MKNITIPVALAMCLVGCGSEAPVEDADLTAANEGSEAVAAVGAPKLPTPNYTSEQLSMVCRAGIAAEFGRSHKIMRASNQSDGLIRVSYNRPDDGKLWKADCKVEGNRIVWRTVDAFGDNGAGRWRTGSDDDVLTFTIQGSSVTTDSSTGMSASETYRF